MSYYDQFIKLFSREYNVSKNDFIYGTDIANYSAKIHHILQQRKGRFETIVRKRNDLYMQSLLVIYFNLITYKRMRSLRCLPIDKFIWLTSNRWLWPSAYSLREHAMLNIVPCIVKYDSSFSVLNFLRAESYSRFYYSERLTLHNLFVFYSCNARFHTFVCHIVRGHKTFSFIVKINVGFFLENFDVERVTLRLKGYIPLFPQRRVDHHPRIIYTVHNGVVYITNYDSDVFSNFLSNNKEETNLVELRYYDEMLFYTVDVKNNPLSLVNLCKFFIQDHNIK
jgi:hypothetical protein